MTEAEWLKCTDPMPMLEFLQEKASDRKLRLFVCSCFRGSSYWSGVEDIVTVGERYADELASRDEIEAARHRALRSGGRQSVVVTVWDTLSHKELVPVFSHELARLETDLVRCGNHFRDIFRNPFRPITLTPEWRTDTALSLAKGMYDSRDFSAMPILADALQDAGCENDDILDHCRGAGPHVRGCWVVDLVLGKD